MSANLEAPDLEDWLKLQPLPFPRKRIVRNRLAVDDAAIVEVGCYCGEGDFSVIDNAQKPTLNHLREVVCRLKL